LLLNRNKDVLEVVTRTNFKIDFDNRKDMSVPAQCQRFKAAVSDLVNLHVWSLLVNLLGDYYR